MMKKLVVALSIFMGFQNAFAQRDLSPIQKNHCDFYESVGLTTILVPLDHYGKISTRDLAYVYQRVENTVGEVNPKTLVYITGGPGVGSIGKSGTAFFNKILDAGLNLILIDPRGVACNDLEYGEVPDELISTDQTALDIIEVIKAEGLKDYVIMGQSYGTLLSTVLTSKINMSGDLNQPELLVLEGTFGRSLKTGLEYHENLVNVFRVEMVKYFPAVNDLFFSGEVKELPYGLPLNYWTNLLISYASLGVETFLKVHPNFVRFLDFYPASLEDKALQSFFTEDFNDYLEFYTEDYTIRETQILSSIQHSYVYYSIMCKEMSPQSVDLGEMVMLNGTLDVSTNSNADICSAFNFSNKPYDSAQHKLKTKTLYFQGTSDGQTPAYYFKYHFDNNLAEKEAVEVVGGGHGLFYTDLQICSVQIWTKIKNGSTDFTNVLDQDGYCLRPDAPSHNDN